MIAATSGPGRTYEGIGAPPTPASAADRLAWRQLLQRMHRLRRSAQQVTNPNGDEQREWDFFRDILDPVVRELLATNDPWEAYQAANAVTSLLTDTAPGGSFSLPHSGEIYAARAELSDLYETGKTPIIGAHTTLREAATRWLDRLPEPTGAFVETWIAEASEAAGAAFARDGDWRSHPQNGEEVVPRSTS